VAFFNRTVNIATDIEFDREFWAAEAAKARKRVQKE